MQDGMFDVLAINETKLDQYDADSSIKLPGYTCIRKDRKKAGGGVCIYIRNAIDFTRRHDLEHKELEIISIENKKPNSNPFLITSWYRPPKTTTESFYKFEKIIIRIDPRKIGIGRGSPRYIETRNFKNFNEGPFTKYVTLF